MRTTRKQSGPGAGALAVGRGALRRLAPMLWLLVLLAPAGAAAADAAAGRDEARPAAAQVIRAGSVVRHQAVALGRDLVVEGTVAGDAVALNGRVEVSGEVEGDVIVLGGDARLAASARVGGDVFVLGGDLETAPGAQIAGRSVAYPNAARVWLTLLEGPALGLEPTAPLVIGAKLALTTVWLVVVLLLTAVTGRQMLTTSQSVAREPLRCFTVGLTGVLAMVMTALFLNLFTGVLIGLPLIALVVLFAILLKLWGMVAAFHALGAWLARRWFRRRLSPLNAAMVGLLVLAAIKLIPIVGLLVWHAASFVGVGAALMTKLGRDEPWFELAAKPLTLTP